MEEYFEDKYTMQRKKSKIVITISGNSVSSVVWN
jgi:hypothetical protein